MIDRRSTVRFEPSSNDGEAVLDVGGTSVEGVVSDLSEGGICIIVTHHADFDEGQIVPLNYQGQDAQAVVRNVTFDMITAAYGMEWVQPLPDGLAPLLP